MNELTLLVGFALIGAPGQPVERMTLIDQKPMARSVCEATKLDREAQFKANMRKEFPHLTTVEVINTCAGLTVTEALRLSDNIRNVVGVK